MNPSPLILLLIVSLFSCSIDASNNLPSQDFEKVMNKKLVADLDVKWIEVNERGYIKMEYPDTAYLFDESLNRIGEIQEYILEPVEILAKTERKRPMDKAKKDYNMDDCNLAHFLKIKQNGVVKIVFGDNVYRITKSYSIKNMTFQLVENYATGAFEDGATGCGGLLPLVAIENGRSNMVDIYEDAPEEIRYLYIQQNELYETIRSIDKTNKGYRLNIHQALQEGESERTVTLEKRSGTWSAILPGEKESSIDYAEIEKEAIKIAKEGNNVIDFMIEKGFNNIDLTAYPFDRLNEETTIAVLSPENGGIKMFVDEFVDGGMYFHHAFYMLEGGGMGEMMSAEGIPNFGAKAIYSIETDTEIYYLIKSLKITSRKDYTYVLNAYVIEDKFLEPIELFKTSKASYSEIEVAYDYYSNADEGWDIISYDPSTKVLKFALIGDKGVHTGKFLVYKWKGNHFRYDGVEK